MRGEALARSFTTTPGPLLSSRIFPLSLILRHPDAVIPLTDGLLPKKASLRFLSRLELLAVNLVERQSLRLDLDRGGSILIIVCGKGDRVSADGLLLLDGVLSVFR